MILLTFILTFFSEVAKFFVTTLKKALKQLTVDMHSRDFDSIDVYER